MVCHATVRHATVRLHSAPPLRSCLMAALLGETATRKTNSPRLVDPEAGMLHSTLYTSSTAQGGGGSFKNRKPIGEVGCESGMAERSHWWIERWLSPLFLSLIIYLPTYLPIYLSIHPSIYLSIYLSIYVSIIIDLSIDLSLSLSSI